MVTSTHNASTELSIALLQAQHREIFSAIQRLADHQIQDTSGEEFSLWMTSFLAMLSEHFSAEENLMVQQGVDNANLAAVKNEHNRLLGMQLSIMDSMMYGKHLPIDLIAKQLATELTTHIAEHDHKYF